jgi:hypothetical protein
MYYSSFGIFYTTLQKIIHDLGPQTSVSEIDGKITGFVWKERNDAKKERLREVDETDEWKDDGRRDSLQK